jgi:hypothetical protein
VSERNPLGLIRIERSRRRLGLIWIVRLALRRPYTFVVVA